MSAKLPALVPFNDPVTVCAACRCACCLVTPGRSCDARRRGEAGSVGLPIAEVQALALEHAGYWKGAPGHDIDRPVDLEALHELIRYQRSRWSDDRSTAIDYLLHGLGIDPDQVAEAMAKEWPEMGGAS